MLEIGARSVGAIAISLAVATLLAYILYRRTSPTLPLKTRVVLGVLRWIAAFMILLLVTDPALRLMRIEHRRPVIAVLLDTSRSMSYPEEAAKMEMLKRALSETAVDALNRKADVRFFTFSDRVAEISAGDIADIEPEGSRTDLVAGVKAVIEGLDTKPSALVVFSDGAVNFGDDAVHFAGSMRIPVHSVSLAQRDPTPDISIDRIETSGLAYADSDVPVWINLSGRNGGDIETELSLSDSTGTVLTRPVSVSGTGATNRIRLTVAAGDVGLHRFEVGLTPFEAEGVVANNVAAFTLKVVKGKVRVCLVAPYPSWDFAFARRCLEEAPNIDVSVMFTAGAAIQPKTTGLVRDLGAVLPELDVLVVLRGAELGRAYDQVKQFVSGGGGMLLLSGDAGSRVFTDLGPFEVSAAAEQRTALYTPVVTAAGRDHEIMTGDAAGGDAMWTGLPPVPIDATVTGLRKQSTALLLGTSQNSKAPLLATARFAAGRVVGFSAYDLWRWDFVPKGFGSEASAFSRLLLGSVGWLTEREEMKHLSLSMSRNTYSWGEPVDVFARVTDDNLRPLPGCVVDGDISDVISGQLIRSLNMSDRGGGSHSVRIDLLPPGRYVLRASARADGETFARETLQFNIDKRGLEDLGFDGDGRLLEGVSSASGGLAYRVENTDALLAEVNPGTVVHRSHKDLNFKLTLGSFLLLVGILGIEWLVRKQKLLI